LANTGDAYLKEGKYRVAIELFKQCLIIIEKSTDANQLKSARIVAANNLLAVAYLNLGLIDSSVICENICQRLGEKISNHHNLYDMYLGFAEFYFKKKDTKKSIFYAQKALEKATQLNAIEKKSTIYNLFYKNYKADHQNNRALEFLEKHKTLEDSIVRSNATKQIATLELTFETARQKAQIDQLTIAHQKQNQKNLLVGLFILIGVAGYIYWNYRKLLQKNAEISAALLKGQRVAIDLHDNLGSTISSIRWSLDAIDQSKMNNHEKEVHQNLYELLNKAYNDVRLLAHNLLPEEFEKQGLAVSLQGFVRKLNKSGGIHFSLQVAEAFGRASSKIEFELYSVCLELTNNIMKHSKATEASIELSRGHNQIKLIVADNGVGLFKNDSDGKGLKNVRDRIESIGEKWEIKTAENQGIANKITVGI
jgi:signal transduction histidine kinase